MWYLLYLYKVVFLLSDDIGKYRSHILYKNSQRMSKKAVWKKNEVNVSPRVK